MILSQLDCLEMGRGARFLIDSKNKLLEFIIILVSAKRRRNVRFFYATKKVVITENQAIILSIGNMKNSNMKEILRKNIKQYKKVQVWPIRQLQ